MRASFYIGNGCDGKMNPRRSIANPLVVYGKSIVGTSKPVVPAQAHTGMAARCN